MAKNKKPDEAKEQDLLKRNREMTEGQSPNVVAKILKEGDKYYCAECHSALPLHTDCPSCHAHIDWDRVFIETRR